MSSSVIEDKATKLRLNQTSVHFYRFEQAKNLWNGIVLIGIPAKMHSDAIKFHPLFSQALRVSSPSQERSSSERGFHKFIKSESKTCERKIAKPLYKRGNLAKMLLKESKKSKDSLKNAKMIAMLIENVQLLDD